jgi:hypothetical protein
VVLAEFMVMWKWESKLGENKLSRWILEIQLVIYLLQKSMPLLASAILGIQ